MAVIYQTEILSVNNRPYSEAVTKVASHADVLRLVTRSSPRTRDKPENVCVGGYDQSC